MATRIPPIRVVIQGVDKFTATIGKSMKGIEKIGKKVAAAGRTMTLAVTLPLVALGAGAIKTSAEFEQSMLKVQNLTGATGAQLASMENQARDLGATTIHSASQAAEGMSFLGMAGFDTNQIISAMPATLDLATAAQVELGESADMVSNILTGYNRTAEQTTETSDILTKAFQSSNTNLTQLAEAMKFVAPAAAGLKVPFKDTTAAIGLLSNAGIQGALAGTKLRAILGALAKPTSIAVGALNRLKIKKSDILDSEGNIKDFRSVIEAFAKSGAKTADLFRIFGTKTAPAMSAIISQGVKGFDKLKLKLDESAGATREAAEVYEKSAIGQLKAFKSAAEELALVLVKDTGILGALADKLGKLTKFVRDLAKSNPALLKMILIIGGIAAALGPLLLIVGKFIIAFGAIGGAVAKAGGVLALLSNPIGWVIAGVIALIAIMKKLGFTWGQIFKLLLIPIAPVIAIVGVFIKKWDKIKPWLVALGMLFKRIFKSMGLSIKPVTDGLESLYKGFEKLALYFGKIGKGILGKLIPEDIQEKVGLLAPVQGPALPATNALREQTMNNIANTLGGGSQKSEILLKVQQPEGLDVMPEFLKGGGNVEMESGRGVLAPQMGY